MGELKGSATQVSLGTLVFPKVSLSLPFHPEVPRGWGITVLPNSKGTLNGPKRKNGSFSSKESEGS